MPNYVYIERNNPPEINLTQVKAGGEQQVHFTLTNTDLYYDQTVTVKFQLVTIVSSVTDQELGYLADSGGTTISEEFTITKGTTDRLYMSEMVIPADTDSGTTYGIQVEIYSEDDTTYPYDKLGSPTTFEVIGAADPNTECLLLTFAAGSFGCTIDDDDETVTANASSGATLTSLSCVYTVSPNAVLSVSAVDKTSPFTQDCSSPVTLVITAEDGVTTKSYTLTITQGSAPGGVDFNLYEALSSVSPNPVGMGQILRVTGTILNDGATDYEGTEGETITLSFTYDGDEIFSDYLNLNKPIPKKPEEGNSYTTFYKDVIIPTGLAAFGVSYHCAFLTYGSNDSTPKYKSFTINNYINTTKTKIFSEKENLFAGNRNYRSPYMLAVNTDLFACNPDNNQQFHLLHSNTECKLWESSTAERWSIVFVVRVGNDPVLFKTLDIELAKMSGVYADLLKIEYATNRQTASQDPFYSSVDTEWNPWNPVYKDEKWHLPIKQEYNPDALIAYQQLKGTYLRITITGQNSDQIVLRNVTTKILKIFN